VPYSRRRAAQKCLVAELPLRVGNVLFELLLLLLETLAQRFHLNLGHMEHQVEQRCRAHGQPARRSAILVELQLHIGQLLNGFGVSTADLERISARIESAFERELRIELHLGAQRARQGDDILQNLDLALRHEIGICGAVLRICRQRDRHWPVRMSLRQPLPQFLGKERHGRMQQPQRRFEGCQQIAPAGVNSGILPEPQLLQLQVPVAEFVPEEMPQHLSGFVITILLDGAIRSFSGAVETAENPAVLHRNFEIAARLRTI
jgi:hypothetical protein